MAADPFDELLEALRCLPGVGARSAQRMALELLERDRDGGRRLARALETAMRDIQRCASCRNFTASEHCRICRDDRRSDRVICAVESPADVLAIEQATGFDGRYFVLLGRLSPLDGIGPEDLGLDLLEARLSDAAVEELIIATNTTVEGEATAYYLREMADRHDVRVSRLAQGVPLGGELEHTDRSTLAHAFASRLPLAGS
ncbi:recombination mediator RecR [Wenzhouxiangella marina]|uniref:Recombination protein RecR n=1 Tax=Wenzhouxiangella marina TaxID=1579979 RepID=A0A0K0XXW3_9GAMM|nr:recombination mediator RecR [Wenzhouxiangella marina]AKS42523.1 Recombination protein RecR [Wenzhouxiangella marina]MBB6085700.1 recombination protein RecR [Wenzhouxiangella marina]